MIKSKAIDILMTLSKEEMKKFGDFLRSPFFTRNKSMISLFEVLKKHYPDFDNSKLTKENIHKKLIPGKKYSDSKVRKLLSELIDLLKKFLIQLNYYANEFHTSSYPLMEELSRRKLNNIFEIEFEKEKNSMKPVGFNYFFEQYLLESLRVAHHLKVGEQSKITKNVKKAADALSAYFLIQSFSSIQDMYANNSAFKEEFKDNLTFNFLRKSDLKNLINDFKKNELDFPELIEICYLWYLMLMKMSDKSYQEHFFKLKRLVLDNIDRMDSGTKQKMEVYLINCCNKKISEGMFEYKIELHEIHKIFAIRNFHEIRKPPVGEYSSTLRIALNVGDIDWAKNLIRQYCSNTTGNDNQNILLYSNSLLSHKSRKFEEALKIVSAIKYENSPQIKLACKQIKLECLYELNYFEEALLQVDSEKHFLRNNVSHVESRINRHSNYITIYEKLLKIKMSSIKLNSLLKKKIHNEIESMNFFHEREWLLEKIDELKN